jgi:hypothetical protein
MGLESTRAGRLQTVSNMNPQEPQSAALPLPRNQSGKEGTNCARVKCKCIPRVDGTTGCERFFLSSIPVLPD